MNQQKLLIFDKIFSMRTLVICIFLSSFGFAQKQQPFEGHIGYHIEMVDTLYQQFFHERDMHLFTNDTLVRVENITDQFGLQVSIRHLILNKSYLLLETPMGNFAIKTRQDTIAEKPSSYSFKKKCGSKKINGMKAKKLIVSHPDFTEPMTFYYFKKLPAHYLEGFDKFPGLLAEYYIPTADGTLKFTLNHYEAMHLNHDLFGIPSDYEKVTMDEFIERMTGGPKEEEQK